MNKKLLFLPFVLVSLILGACGGGTTGGNSSESSSDSTSTLPEWVDYVNESNVRLSLDYKGRDFYQDGIGEVTLRMTIDGDTAHFNPVVTTTSDEAIKARFYGIDTPESTGQVQQWGKEASDFTKSKLKEAAENGTIVVSSPLSGYGKPTPDSTGERYVSLVWINTEVKNASYEDLILLNLWIVQEGLSWVKNVGDIPEYTDAFYAAEQQARDYKLNMFSGEIPPSWPDSEYQVVSLLDLKRDTVGLLTQSDYVSLYDNVRVRIQGTVAGFANNILYLQDYFDEDISGTPGGEFAGINIFVGMSPIPSKYTKQNTYLEICGLAQYSENFGFQITDTQGRFPSGSPFNDTDTQIIFTADENVDDHKLTILEYSGSELNAVTSNQTFECLFCAVKVTDIVTVSNVYIASSNEITVYFENYTFQAYVTFLYRGDPERPNYTWTTEDDWIGKQFYISGVYTFHQTASGRINYQINPTGSADLVWVPN